MEYVPLQVPEHLYLQCLGFLGSADVEHHASAEIVAENQELRQQVYDQREENDRLRALLDDAVGANGEWQKQAERLQRQYDQLAVLYDAQLAAAGKLDQDDSYPDHGPADDAAAAMGLPSQTAGTAPSETPPAPSTPSVPAPEAQPEPEPAAPAATFSERGVKAAATVAARYAGPVARFLEDTVADADDTEFMAAPTLHELYVEWQKQHPDQPVLKNVELGKGLSGNGLRRKQASKPVPGFDTKVRPTLWYGIRPLTAAERNKRATEQVRTLMATHPRTVREEVKDEPEVTPYIAPAQKAPPKSQPILAVKNHEQIKDGKFAGVRVIKADGKVTWVDDSVLVEDEQGAEPIPPEKADAQTFDVWADYQHGYDKKFSYLPEVLALNGLDQDAIQASVREPERVEIRPESRDKGYPVLKFVRGDVQVVLGFRNRMEPAVIAAYWDSVLSHDTHRVNRGGGGGSRKSVGLPGTVKVSVKQLRDKGLQIPDTWESATQPIEVSYKGQVLGKMKVHLANKSQVQGDYQRLLRQAHAIDRREEAKVG